MSVQIALEARELELLLEVLEAERRNVRSEIHHTDSTDYKHSLQERLQLVDSLLERLHTLPAPA